MGGKITIIGLGSGNEDQLSLGIYKLLKNTKNLYLRTRIHPVVDFLKKERIAFKTFDYLYDTLTDYDQVYSRIASSLIGEASTGKSLVYAVPGHPMVAERSVQYILQRGEEQNVSVNVLGGESFLDTAFSRLQIDPIEGLLFLNGETLTLSDLNPTKNTIIGQVYNQWVASEVKLTLMEIYPDEMPIYITSNLGIIGEEVIKKVPLYELDHNPEDFHHLSSLFIPKVKDEKILERNFSRLVEIVQILRSPNGCPWDRKQTHQSIRKNLIEETYELVETIDEMDMEHMEEELGDVLLQVMLHSQIAEEEGFFNIYDVIQQLNQKLVRRHPHVFGDENANEAEEALEHWHQIKQQEKIDKGKQSNSILDGIPKDLPAILKAYKLQKKAAKVGFDWTEITDVYKKIQEEFEEVKSADKSNQMEELGDLLFAVVNLARFMKIDPEEALAKTNTKFIKRFNYIENKLKELNIPIEEASLELMEKYWIESKSRLI
ncbi:nucleoside triphosphate pyrophosphohydrolase [Vulcanibacillus modesticaldus]|uniref:Nucleoside triphosphate pyrophosphohydrolase n=1 Tax=Vulcanibacillus modesticaldus TaxID=337097 RepID=A0A1D2YX53_9BACI|nr:nucleoside triphosphate pyrophosphohydrolase [Vulcanibacillus modesticaldus]OEG00299.1 nucleoside triphosphate pyrophosphohydrolase [Vulcanibacillus modesticaldus]